MTAQIINFSQWKLEHRPEPVPAPVGLLWIECWARWWLAVLQ